jgi:hypothetical protein
MDGVRYKGYVAVREAIAAQPIDPLAAETLEDLAEGLLLARNEVEAEATRDAVPAALVDLVDRRVMTRRAADRFWVHLKACSPAPNWPPSWDRSPVSAPRGALRGL